MVGFSVDAGVEQHVLVGGKLPQVTVHDTLQLVRGGTHGLHLGVQVVARKVGCGEITTHTHTRTHTHTHTRPIKKGASARQFFSREEAKKNRTSQQPTLGLLAVHRGQLVDGCLQRAGGLKQRVDLLRTSRQGLALGPQAIDPCAA